MAGENLLVVDDSPTILKVVESALTRAGYRVDTAQDVVSGMALARSRRPAVILIDSLIQTDGETGFDAEARDHGADTDPDHGSPGRAETTGGFKLCGALAADAALSRTPVVLMTAKGEDLEARYSKASNVIDYITKPFSPDAVLAVVAHVIEKTGRSQPADPTGHLGAAGSAGVGHGTGPGRPSAVAEALSRSVDQGQASGSLARLREVLADRLEQYRQESGAWDIPTITRGALADDTLSLLLAEAGFEAGQSGAAAPDLGGQLGAISMSEVLTLLGQQSQTGVLRVLTDGARVDLFFRKGHIELAAAVGVAEEFLLGRFAVEAGDLTPEALARVLEERDRQAVHGKPPLFGRDLVARGLITPERLKSAMRRQTAELIYETLRWSRGSFQFKKADELPETAQEAGLEITVDTVLLEGFRRVDEWRLIERDIQNFDLVFVRAEDRIGELPRGTLTRDEIAVLDALTGRSSVRDVVRTLRMGSFDVSKILYRLLRTKLIRRRIQPIASS
jgi:DNA-binding response OmpR family regulator